MRSPGWRTKDLTDSSSRTGLELSGCQGAMGKVKIFYMRGVPIVSNVACPPSRAAKDATGVLKWKRCLTAKFA